MRRDLISRVRKIIELLSFVDERITTLLQDEKERIKRSEENEEVKGKSKCLEGE